MKEIIGMHTYDKVSRLVQYRWGQRILECRKWNGNETVMDAGCGSGLPSKLLAQRVPRGNVYLEKMDCSKNFIHSVIHPSKSG
jgi:trans-aconitate methyltransferase